MGWRNWGSPLTLDKTRDELWQETSRRDQGSRRERPAEFLGQPIWKPKDWKPGYLMARSEKRRIVLQAVFLKMLRRNC